MWRLAVAAPALVALAACNSAASKAGEGVRSSGTTPTRAPAGIVLLTKLQNHTTVDVKVGERVRVRLDSTYWRFAEPAGTALRGTAKPRYAPGGDCVPGGGCGTVIADYAAVRRGTAQVSASRLSCGEVVLCAPNARTFTVTVVVAG